MYFTALNTKTKSFNSINNYLNRSYKYSFSIGVLPHYLKLYHINSFNYCSILILKSSLMEMVKYLFVDSVVHHDLTSICRTIYAAIAVYYKIMAMIWRV